MFEDMQECTTIVAIVSAGECEVFVGGVVAASGQYTEKVARTFCR